MALIGILTLITLICMVSALILLYGKETSDIKLIMGTLFGILGIAIYIGGMVYIAPMYSLTEIKTVDVCDKFATDGVYSIATNDGNTYRVDYKVYGFIPAKGNVTLELYTDGFFGTTTVNKILGNTTCQVGC